MQLFIHCFILLRGDVMHCCNMPALEVRDYVNTTVSYQDDIEKLLGQSHSLLSETYSSEVDSILKSTEVWSGLIVWHVQY